MRAVLFSQMMIVGVWATVPDEAKAGPRDGAPDSLNAIAESYVMLILDIGDPLVGRLLLVDALDMSFHEVQLRRDPNCPVCSEQAGPIEYIDYDEFCAGGAHASAH
jgi:adenylyltransferase/sulfurtransferase